MTTDERPIYRVTLTDDEIESLLASETPDMHGQRDSILRVGIVDRALTAQQELRQTTRDLDTALVERAEAVIREKASQASYDHAKVAITDGLYALDLIVGANAPTREANLRALLQEDERLVQLGRTLADATAARIRAEADERAADVLNKSLRAECYLLGALAGN